MLTVNLSSVDLTDSDINLLDKGLTFVPVPKTLPLRSVIENKDRLIRNIKLRSFFSNSNSALGGNKSKPFQARSTWTPSNGLLPTAVNETLASLDNATLNLIKNAKKIERNDEIYLKLNDKSNIGHDEFNSIKKLKNDKSIIIKSADKGGATVIMDLDNYIFEANRQLNDIKYYQPLQEPIYLNNVAKIRNILYSMRSEGFITDKQLAFLGGPTQPRHRIFYLLPKIHKESHKWTLPGRMPEGRPIVSDVESESYRASKLLDSFLTPLANRHASYLKNTYDFVEKIRGVPVNENCFIVTGDVSALYTNMLHDRTIACVRDIFMKYPDVTRPDKHLLELLEVTLKNNDFQFNGKCYLQTCGTPMGKVYAPALANIYMMEFDDRAMNDYKIKPQFFFRYLDDIIFVWTG